MIFGAAERSEALRLAEIHENSAPQEIVARRVWNIAAGMAH